MATRTRSVIVGGEGGIDATDFKDVAKVLRLASKETTTDMRKQLRAAGEIVAQEARVIASGFSTTIPPTVKVRVAGGTVAVVAGNKDVPIAALEEVGNSQGHGKSQAASRKGFFRHPVFGDRDVWVNQKMHRFLGPAADAKAVEANREILRVMDKAQATIVELHNA